MLQTGHINLSSTPDKQLENHSTKYHRQQPLYNTLELLMMGIVVPETCWTSNKICNKNLCCIYLAFYFHFVLKFQQKPFLCFYNNFKAVREEFLETARQHLHRFHFRVSAINNTRKGIISIAKQSRFRKVLIFNSCSGISSQFNCYRALDLSKYFNEILLSLVWA